MKFFIANFILIVSVFGAIPADASLLGDLMKEVEESAEKRRANFAELAPTVIPASEKELRVSEYVASQLEQEGDKKTGKDRKEYQKIITRLRSWIGQWQDGNFDKNLPKTLKSAQKLNRKYQTTAVAILNEIEQEENILLAQRKEEEREREEKSRKAQSEYMVRCGEAASDDPFASFNFEKQDREVLSVKDGNQRYLYEANENNCIWVGDASDSAKIAKLAPIGSFTQNSNDKLQYILTSPSGEQLILDFAKDRCLKRDSSGSQSILSCEDPSVVAGSTAPKATVKKQPTSADAPWCSSYISELDKNEMKTLRKYKNRTVKVKGRIKGIEADIWDNPVIRLKGTDAQYGHCLLYPKNDKADWIYDLSKGQLKVFECDSFSEVMGSPTMKNCMPI